MRIVEPTVLRPWRERIAGARTLGEVERIGEELGEFRVLDPACGSGNFLYVAFREMKELELGLFTTILDRYPSVQAGAGPPAGHGPAVPRDRHEPARRGDGEDHALDGEEVRGGRRSTGFTQQHRFLDEAESPLPFDNLDTNIVVGGRALHGLAGGRRDHRQPAVSVGNQDARRSSGRPTFSGSVPPTRIYRATPTTASTGSGSARRARRRRAGRARRDEHDPAEPLARGRARLHRPERRDDRRGRRDDAVVGAGGGPCLARELGQGIAAAGAVHARDPEGR